MHSVADLLTPAPQCSSTPAFQTDSEVKYIKQGSSYKSNCKVKDTLTLQSKHMWTICMRPVSQPKCMASMIQNST